MAPRAWWGGRSGDSWAPRSGRSQPTGDSTGTPDFFSTPQNPRLPNPEPPEFPLLRDMLFRKIMALQADPYGGQTFSNQGRGLMDPRTGAYPSGGHDAESVGYDGTPGGLDRTNMGAYKDWNGRWRLQSPQWAGQTRQGSIEHHGTASYDKQGVMHPVSYQGLPGQPDQMLAPWSPTEQTTFGELSKSTDPTAMQFVHSFDAPKPSQAAQAATAMRAARGPRSYEQMNPGSHAGVGSTPDQNADSYQIQNTMMGQGSAAQPDRSRIATPSPRPGMPRPARNPRYDARRPLGGGLGQADNVSRAMQNMRPPSITEDNNTTTPGGGPRWSTLVGTPGHSQEYNRWYNTGQQGPPPADPGYTAPGGAPPPPLPDESNQIPGGGGNERNVTPIRGGGPPAGGGGAPGGQSTTMPWLNSYQGNFTAPMSPEESAGLDAYGNFASSGSGTGPSQGYYNDVLGGNYLDFNKNPWLQQILKSGQGIKDYQDKNALARIQSSMAAGGNAISGANTQAQSDYLNQSGNNFENTMGNLFSNQYQNERGLQNAAATGSNASGWQQGQGIQNYFNMGSVPRTIQQNDLNAQYGDWRNQMGNARDAYQYPDYLTNMEMSHGYPGSYDPTYGASGATGLAALIQQLLGNSQGGGIDWGSILSGVGAGVGAATSGGDANPVGYDGRTLPATSIPDTDHRLPPSGYDAGPTSYKDSAWYNKALDTENAQRQKIAQARTQSSGGTKAAGIVALLMALLQGYSNQKKKAGGGAKKPGVGGAPSADKGKDKGKDPFADPTHQNTIYNDPIGPNYETQGLGNDQFNQDGSYNWDYQPPGTSTGDGVSNIDWSNYGYPGDTGTGSNTELSNFLDQYPPGDYSGGDTYPGEPSDSGDNSYYGF